MKSKSIRESLKWLNEDDIINDVLYLIYKASNNEKYSTLSELAYILDKDTLFKLCSVLGGCELKIPTILELKLFISALYVFYAMQSDGLSFERAFNNVDLDSSLKKPLYNIYVEILGDSNDN